MEPESEAVSDEILATDPEKYYLEIAPCSATGKRGKELIYGYFTSNPEAIPRKTSVYRIAKVSIICHKIFLVRSISFQTLILINFCTNFME